MNRSPNTRELQQALAELGPYSGAVDGVWGPLSQAAWLELVSGYRRCHPPEPDMLRPKGWVWSQSRGALFLDGRPIARGYSGRDEGRNAPWREAERSLGPIPAGRWRISRPRHSARTGPHVLDLQPLGHDAHGRTAFQIHGDNARGDASSGCIILPRAVREQIAESGLDVLEVVP